MTNLELYNLPAPIATETYSPVAHKDIIDSIREELDKRNMSIINTRYNHSADGKRLIGFYDIEFNGDTEMGMRFGFRNSYDKSMSVAAVSGMNIWICENGCISSDGMQFMRKHTGSVVRELKEMITIGADNLEDRFLKLQEDSNKMKQIELSKVQAAEMYGRMFMINEIITPTQLSIVKRELNQPTFDVFNENNLWSAYNHVTYALKESHPNNYINQHINLHEFVKKEFSL